jgi:serine/threonine protein kinase
MLSLVNAVHETNAVAPARRWVGPYRLCIELASGGMASVYLARPDLGSGRASVLAVKIIHPHLAADADFVQMFMDEAELASQIRHANVCSVLDYANEDGEYYIAMEYLLGESLMGIWNRISRGPCDDRVRLSRCVAHILSDACEGLHAAHQLTDVNGESLDIVHRDVSPENVFVTYDGVGKVMDFGIASAARKRHKTQTGLVKGKFAYVAPECLRGTKADRRADLWGIGVIAWELLTGKRLFRRDTDLETLQAVSDEPIPRPSEIQADVPKEIEDIVMRALEREPERRYASARELARDLARFAARGDDVITAADVADWLDVLVPGGRVRRRQILELARLVDNCEGEVTRVGSKLASQPPASARRPIARSSEPPPPPEPAPGPTTLWAGGTRTPSEPPPKLAFPPVPIAGGGMRRRALTLVAVGFACGGAVALLWRASMAHVTSPPMLVQPGASARANAVPAPLSHQGEILLRIRVESPNGNAQEPTTAQIYLPPTP